MDAEQKNRFSSAEMAIIRSTFKNDEVLYAIRNTFYGLPADKIKLSDDALKIIKKVMIPDLSADVPFGQQADLYFSLKINEMQFAEAVAVHIEARDLAIQWLKAKFLALCGAEDVNKLTDLRDADGKTSDKRQVQMMAYLFLTNSFIDSMLIQLRTLALSVELTEEEKKKQLEKNSSK